MDNKDFKLDADDAALIFKKDLSTEMYLPNFDSEEVVDFDENQNVYVAIAISLALNDEDFRSIIGNKINTILQASEVSSEGGCSGCGGNYHSEDCEEE
jgi:hypothetical protein